MAGDDDTIYVDVAARFDEASADRAIESLRDKFSHAGDSLKDSLSGALGSVADHVKGIGGTLHDTLTDHVSGLGDKGGGLGDALDGLGERAGTALGDGIGSAIRDALKGKFGNILGDGLGPAVDQLKELGSQLAQSFSQAQQHVEGVATSVQEAVKAAGSGDFSSVLNSAAAAADHLGQLGEQYNSKTLRRIGNFAPVLSGGSQIAQNFVGPDAPDNKGVGDIVGDLIEGGTSGAQVPGPGWLRAVTTATGAGSALWRDRHAIGHSLTPQGSGPPGPDLSTHSAGALSNMLLGQPVPRDLYGPPNTSQGPTTGVSTGEVEVQAGSANVSAGTVVLSGGIQGLGLGLGLPRVSGGAWEDRPDPNGHKLDPNGYPSSGKPAPGITGSLPIGRPRGGSAGPGDILGQLGLPSHDQGGLLPGGSPGQDNQLFSGEGGEFVVNPQATRQNLGQLQAINSGGPNFNEQNVNGPKEQQKMGEGSGFGLTGQGLIGLAQSLPGIAAAGAGGAGPPGAGAGAAAAAALWSNIGQPELNEAVKKGTQIGAALALAPIESTWLGGGQMGAPTVGSPDKAGWTGKLLGSLLGSQFSTPNIAGAFQPPKNPQQQDQGKEDPGAAGKPQQGGGPTGHKDDPIHVQPVGGQPQPPMGANQSGSSVTSVGSASVGLS